MLWGSAPALIKTGYSLLHIQNTGSILLFAGTRFFLAGVLVLLLAALRQKRFPAVSKNSWKPVCVLAFLQTFGQYLFYYLGAANASGMMVSLLSGTGALLAVMLACWLFHMERMTPLKLLGCLLGLAGIFIMNLKGLRLQFSFAGEGLVLISQIFSALSTIMLRIYSSDHDPVLLSGWQFVFGGGALMACGLAAGGQIAWNLQGSPVLLWLAVVSAGAYSLWGLLLAHWPVSSVSIFTCAIPVFGVAFSWLFLGEIPGWSAMAALLLIMTGILCINLKQEGSVDEKTAHE